MRDSAATFAFSRHHRRQRSRRIRIIRENGVSGGRTINGEGGADATADSHDQQQGPRSPTLLTPLQRALRRNKSQGAMKGESPAAATTTPIEHHQTTTLTALSRGWVSWVVAVSSAGFESGMLVYWGWLSVLCHDTPLQECALA